MRQAQVNKEKQVKELRVRRLSQQDKNKLLDECFKNIQYRETK